MNTIIFLHGGTLNKSMWLPQIEELKNEFHIIAIDLPRHGVNIKKPFTLESAVNIVAQYIESENLTSKFTIVGLSLGGYVAIEYTDKYPEQISGLILSGCCVQYLGVMGFLAKFTTLLSSLTSQNKFEKKQKQTLLKVSSNNIVKEIYESGLSLLGGKESLKEVIGKDFVTIVNRIDVPILLLNGANDTLNRRYENKYLEDNSNVSLKVIKDCGHLCSLEKPRLFSQEIRNFMSVINT